MSNAAENNERRRQFNLAFKVEQVRHGESAAHGHCAMNFKLEMSETDREPKTKKENNNN